MLSQHTLSLLTIPRPLTYWDGQGGVYIGLKATPCGAIYHLIASMGTHVPGDEEWGPPSNVKGADCYHDGRSNTRAMAKAGSSLAETVMGLDIDGHKDWYIPSRADGQLLAANASHLLGEDWYWLSTQQDGENAWAQTSSTQQQIVCGKQASFRTVPVRVVRVS